MRGTYPSRLAETEDQKSRSILSWMVKSKTPEHQKSRSILSWMVAKNKVKRGELKSLQGPTGLTGPTPRHEHVGPDEVKYIQAH